MPGTNFICTVLTEESLCWIPLLKTFILQAFGVHLIFPTYRILKVVASFLSPTAFALGSVNFADYERAHVGLRWSNIWRVCSILGDFPVSNYFEVPFL